jgi:hypothetical protein
MPTGIISAIADCSLLYQPLTTLALFPISMDLLRGRLELAGTRLSGAVGKAASAAIVANPVRPGSSRRNCPRRRDVESGNSQHRSNRSLDVFLHRIMSVEPSGQRSNIQRVT